MDTLRSTGDDRLQIYLGDAQVVVLAGDLRYTCRGQSARYDCQWPGSGLRGVQGGYYLPLRIPSFARHEAALQSLDRRVRGQSREEVLTSGEATKFSLASLAAT